MTRLRTCLALLALGMAGLMPVLAQAAAGEVTMLTGRGYATDVHGNTRELAHGAPVHAGETLSTGPGSYLNVRFSDGGLLLLRPDSRLAVTAYRHGDDAPTSNSALRLLKGGLRAVSGAIGREQPEQYRVITPVATIGIRGTDFMADIVPDVLRNRIGDLVQLLRSLRLPPGTRLDDAAIFGVYDGAIEVTSHQGGRTSLLRAGEFLAAFGDGRHQPLAGMPPYLQRDPLPDPQQCQ